MNQIAYCFGIGKVDLARYSEALTKATGFIACADLDEVGEAVIFETENDAKITRNLLDFAGAIVSKNVIMCYVNDKEVKAAKEKKA